MGTRAICRREDAHPGAQLRFTDHDGHRFQVFLTDQADPDVAALELRHRQRARVEDRIRAAKATGLNLPFDLWRHNAVWLELVGQLGLASIRHQRLYGDHPTPLSMRAA